MSRPACDGVSPVRGDVSGGRPDLVLLNPALTGQWRRVRLRAALRPRTVLIGLTGAVLAALAMVSGAPLVAAFGATVAAAGALAARRDATSLPASRAARALRRGGGGAGPPWLRASAFLDCGAAGTAARALLVGVDELHRSPARSWLDDAVCGEVHRVVWEALRCLDHTHTARRLVHQLAAHADTDPEVGALAERARQAVAAVDDALDDLADQLHGCLLVTRAWEAKLRHHDLAARTDHALAALPDPDHLHDLVAAARVWPESVFAHITAARDVTGAGAFPWQRDPATWHAYPGREPS